MSFEVKVKSRVVQTKEELERAVERALERVGLQAESFAKARCPSGTTGNLRNSITHEVEEKSVMIGTGVDYGKYVEFGTGIYSETGGRNTPWVYQGSDGRFYKTVGQRPQPFLRPAVRDHTGEFTAIIKSEFGN